MLKTTKSAENLSSSVVEDAEVGSIGSGSHKDETVRRSLLTSKNLNRATGYLIPDAK